MKNNRMTGGLAVLAFCAMTLWAQAQTAGFDRIPTSGGPIELVPIQHASLMFTWNGEHILIDPTPLSNGGGGARGARGASGDAGGNVDVAARYKSMATPDFILITHIHGDHFSVPILEAIAGPNTVIVAPQNVHDAMPADLQAKTKVLKNGDTTMLAAVRLEAVPMYNVTPERVNFHPKGAGNGYILTFADKRIYIAGDTEETPELAHLPNIDVAFIPMGLPYTQTVEAAAKWVRDFRPKIVFPYHYRLQDGTTSDTAAFESLVGNASVVRLRKWY